MLKKQILKKQCISNETLVTLRKIDNNKQSLLKCVYDRLIYFVKLTQQAQSSFILQNRYNSIRAQFILNFSLNFRSKCKTFQTLTKICPIIILGIR